ncbi:MAG TPA: hypothetical protein ENK19_11245 [Acidobacteria bacterium]|nr:hypothetical protein [Acidobacteriota bacterium]
MTRDPRGITPWRRLRPGTVRAAWLGTVVLLAATLPIGVVNAAQPGRLPPVAIFSPRPTTPLETAGTGLAPKAQVRMHITAKGSVARVEVSSIDPSSPYDGLFKAALLRTLKRWRFAPAMEDGRAVEGEISWQIEFPPAARNARQPYSTGSLTNVGAELFVSPDTVHRQRLYRVFTLPLKRQRHHLDELAATATRFLDPGRLVTVSSPLATVSTDHPSGEKAARAILANVQTTLAVVRDVLAANLPLEPSRLKLRIFVYSNRASYQRFIAAVDGIVETDGVYIPPGLIAFHTALPSNEDVLSVLIHESAHAFVGRYLLRPGEVFPRWLSEGLADYFSNSPVEKHRLVPGKRRKSQFYRVPMGFWRGTTHAALDLKSVRRAIENGTALPVRDLLAAGRDAFYGRRMRQYYAQSWLLVHFLRHGEPQWKQREFPELLLYAAEGYDPRLVIPSVYGLSPDQLEQRYRRHVREFFKK